jgi:hypothetical protein
MGDELRGLVMDGEFLLQHASDPKSQISDYSYLVFPFSKAYEGFLKKLFLDIGLIDLADYYGDDIRIGKILNPHFLKERRNVFLKLCGKDEEGKVFSHKLWNMWKNGRNLVFHYFPHNFRKLSLDEATEIIRDIVDTMDAAVTRCNFLSVSGKKK